MLSKRCHSFVIPFYFNNQHLAFLHVALSSSVLLLRSFCAFVYVRAKKVSKYICEKNGERDAVH